MLKFSPMHWLFIKLEKLPFFGRKTSKQNPPPPPQKKKTHLSLYAIITSGKTSETNKSFGLIRPLPRFQGTWKN